MPKVTIANCTSYNSELEAVVRDVLEPLGGIKAFVAPGNTVLIKPNMLTDRDPEQAVTTHPELVRAVIRLVKAAGGAPCIGDSPASAVKIDRVMERCGFVKLCEEEQIPLVRFESAGSIPVERNGFKFNIAKPVIEADLVINMPKVKTHVLTTLTAAVKNTYGTVPGYQKGMLHKQYANPHDFGKLVWEIQQEVAPELNIADAIIGMEGHGPAGGTPIPLNFVAASASAVAMDLAFCDLLGIDRRAVPYLPPGISTSRDTEPELHDLIRNGIAIEPRSIKLPSTLAARLIPRWLTRILEPFVWIRPSIDETCIRCGKCVKACPAEALAMPIDDRPQLTPEACIGCCCCHEVCPANAIEMTQSPLLNFIRKGKLP